MSSQPLIQMDSTKRFPIESYLVGIKLIGLGVASNYFAFSSEFTDDCSPGQTYSIALGSIAAGFSVFNLTCYSTREYLAYKQTDEMDSRKKTYRCRSVVSTAMGISSLGLGLIGLVGGVITGC